MDETVIIGIKRHQQPNAENALRLQAITDRLKELNVLQYKHQPVLELPTAQSETEVTVGIRVGSAYVLRCLKVWYDLKTDVIVNAIHLLDMFLTRMKVQPKHMACISIASFHLACQMSYPSRDVPDPSRLIAISQCQCTVSDLQRMKSIITSKLKIEPSDRLITSFTFLSLFHQIFLITDHDSTYVNMVNETELYRCSEIVVCEGSYAKYKPSEVALSLICVQLNVAVVEASPRAESHILQVISEIQDLCEIKENVLNSCMEMVVQIVEGYNSATVMPYRQRLAWPVSRRTFLRLRPTNKLVTVLPTIQENCDPGISEVVNNLWISSSWEFNI